MREQVDLEKLKDMIGLVLPSGSFDDDMLEQLTETEREEFFLWLGDCHLEASDNNVIAGPMPETVRDKLPLDHTYKTWRVS